jgi:hypothetical protein
MIYIKTPAGQQAFKERSAAFTSKMRTVFLLFDGIRDASAVLASTAGLGVEPRDIEHLLQLGFIDAVSVKARAASTTVTASIPAAELDEHNRPYPTMSVQDRYIEASHLATALTSKLGLMGFRLNLAVESAANLEELRALLPKIEAACGHDAVYSLQRVLHEPAR